MDSSDDYIFDDLVLDDQTLAILDQSEQKYLKETSAAAIPGVLDEPVNKRLKTTAGWIPGTGAAQTVEEELPEISLQGDGTYGVTGQARYMKDVSQRSLPRTRQINTPARVSVLSNNIGQTANQSTNSSGSHLPNPRAARPVNNRQRQQHSTTYGQNHDRKPLAVEDQDPQGSPVLAQLTALQQKLDQLREENSKMKTALQEAVDTKLAKDGEVSILRKNMEKNALSHAAQLLQLRTEKEKADTKQLQMQKEMKDEIERLRTQFLFRQQELESTIRKPPASVRAKKLGRDFPSTPLALPSAISGWSRGAQKPVEETPIRHARLQSASNRMSPTRPRKSPEKIKNGMLPGFENAFETSTPRKSPSKRIARVKQERIIEPPIFGPDTKNDLRLPSQLSQGPSQFQFEPLPKQTEAHEIFTLAQRSGPTSEQSQTNDIEMDVAPMESDEDIVLEELDMIQPTNWKAELCRIILTHSFGSTEDISFQQILSASNLSTSANDYTASCGRILEVISTPSRSDDYDGLINAVSQAFLSLLTMSSNIQSQPNLTILFNLLTKLVISIPAFRTSLLSCRIPFQENRPATIIEVICSIVLKYLQPAAPRDDTISVETLAFLDALCFHVDDHAIERLEPLARNRETLMVLLHPLQTSWFLERSTRLLVLLSTHHELCKVLFDMPDGGNVNVEAQMNDALFERLCSHLINADIHPSSNLKMHILTYFGQLSISRAGALGILGASYALIPSLVLYISQLTCPLWEDDGSLAYSDSAETTSSTVKALNQATFLLYHLIFGIEPNHNLRYTLQHAPHRPFNCISHIFVVTFGRLSYSEPPNWIEASKRQELESLAEIAREILELVVDGPEGDSVWAAFQSEPDEDKIDEEDMEAQLMGNVVG